MSKKILIVLVIVFTCALFMGAAIHESIFHTADKRVVREVYTVKAGDTLWDIAMDYSARDCRNIYFPEFKCEIEQQNPFLIERKGLIRPGDKIVVEYVEYIK